MDLANGYLSNEHQEQFRLVSESADPLSVSPLQMSSSPKSPRSPKVSGSPKSPRSPKLSGSPKSPRSPKPSGSPKSPQSPKSPSSPRSQHGMQGTSKGSPLKNQRNSHSSTDGRPKKGGAGGKGTWGSLLDTDGYYILDRNDPNYNSNEDIDNLQERKISAQFEEYKKKATEIVEEYFETDDITMTANELRSLGKPNYDFYFVKKLISVAMDRHDKEKEMAAVLLSSLYAESIDPSQVRKGFTKLLQSADDLIVDIPDAVDVLALFVARAVVDEILFPAFLSKALISLPENSKGFDVIKRAEKVYLSAPMHSEIIERRWAGNKTKSAEDVKGRINNLLEEYISSGDKKEAYRCIKDLNVPFFHHEIVKRAVIMAMEKRQAESCLLDLLKTAFEEGRINSSQITKGFGRIIGTIDDLSLDIPNAKSILQSLISKAASDGWLSVSSLSSFPLCPEKNALREGDAKVFKTKAESMIREYFLSSDISEVVNSLETENKSCSGELNAIFVKKLITLAMDRKNREKEMASVLLSSLCFPADDVVNGFLSLIEAADDTALDNPVVVEDLAMFLARAVVDEVLAPQNLEDIADQYSSGCDSIGQKAIQMAKSLLKARLSGERILRCWGGGGSCKNGWTIEDVKDKIGKILEEFNSGGDIREGCRCIKDLGMPFFHHEVVKKSMIKVMEERNDRLWILLNECFNIGLITTNQMMEGFVRVAESLDDLVLDVPDAKKQYKQYVDKAMNEGWLDSSFELCRSEHAIDNGFV